MIFSILSLSIDAFVDIADDEGFFQFSPKAKFTSPLYVYIALKQNHCALQNY